MRIRVVKSDASVEPYLYTKILGTFHNALSCVNDDNLFAAEQMAEAVTYYLYQNKNSSTITTDELHLMVISVLNSTGFASAAGALRQHRLGRKLARRRIEFVYPSASTGDAEPDVSPWNKSCIVEGLVRNHHVDRLLARTIAASVEEKVLRLGLTRVHCLLIEHLVASDTEAMSRAHSQLQAAL